MRWRDERLWKAAGIAATATVVGFVVLVVYGLTASWFVGFATVVILALWATRGGSAHPPDLLR